MNVHYFNLCIPSSYELISAAAIFFLRYHHLFYPDMSFISLSHVFCFTWLLLSSSLLMPVVWRISKRARELFYSVVL